MDELTGPVLIVGAGLIGTSIGLALAQRGIATYVRDADDTTARIAASRGAGSTNRSVVDPELVVVAVPPVALASQIAAALAEFPEATVTDVGSVKAQLLEELRLSGMRLDRYVGSHPMAGSERSGPLAARADLFEGRAWAVVARADCDPEAVRAQQALVLACGAVAVPMAPEEHDRAVALISHLPHVAAALVAQQLADAPQSHLALSGSGVRDVTRIAAGDPLLWEQILLGNAEALRGMLEQLRGALDALISSLAEGDGAALRRYLALGAAGAAAIPGKHGGVTVSTETVVVAVPDTPGALANLFGAVSGAGVNIEDVRIDHDTGRPAGHVELVVASELVEALMATLAGAGWHVER